MALGRLYTITSMGKRRLSLLKRAKQLNPNSPTPNKYLAIAHVDAMYQYESAIEELTEYIRKKPGDVFGHNLLGYLYFCIGKYREATEAFEKACQLNPDNIYGYCKLSRSYGALYLQASPSDSERALYKEQAIKMLKEATRIASIDPRRIGWLKEWLKKKHILYVATPASWFGAQDYRRGASHPTFHHPWLRLRTGPSLPRSRGDPFRVRRRGIPAPSPLPLPTWESVNTGRGLSPPSRFFPIPFFL
jgi:tetratricopeptide (TPR) repeat protein